MFLDSFTRGVPEFNPVVLIGSLTDGFPFRSFLACLVLSFIAFVLLIKRGDTADASGEHPIDKNRSISASDNYGKSVFEQPWQYRSLAQIRPVDSCVGHIFGMLDDRGRECIDFYPDPEDPSAHLNSHIFAIGASGSGKTYSIGKTYCYQSIKLGHSVIHTDPKGELFSDMASVYRKHGYYVRRLNFNNPMKSDGWDCMKSLRTASSPMQAQILAEKFAAAVVSQICSDTSNIYYSGPVMLLKALLLRLVLDDDIPDSEKNIKKIYSWITDSGGIAFLDTLFNRDLMPPKLLPCLAPWGTFKGASGNLAGNLLVNLGAGISVLSTGVIADILSTDDIDLLMPGTKPCAYFIQFPVPNDAFSFPVALFFTMFFETLQNYATEMPGHRLPRQVDCMLDEFAQAGIFPKWDQRMSVLRSFGINVFMIVQTITQFRNLYKDAQDTIISNCATWLMLGTNDYASADMFSRRIGQTTIEVVSESRDRKNIFPYGGMDRYSVGTGKTSLLSPDEIMKLPSNTIVILFQRHNPVFANSIPNVMHPYYREVETALDEDEPFFYDSDNIHAGFPSRETRKRNEDALIGKYWSTHSIAPLPSSISGTPYADAGNNVVIEILRIIRDDIAYLLQTLRKRLKRRSASENSCDSHALPETANPEKDAESYDEELFRCIICPAEPVLPLSPAPAAEHKKPVIPPHR